MKERRFEMVAQTGEGSFVQMSIFERNMKRAIVKAKTLAPDCLVFPKPKDKEQCPNTIMLAAFEKALA